MQQRQVDGHTYVLRIEKGENAIQTISDFCSQQKIDSGFFYGIGAVDMAEIAHYDIHTKQYFRKRLEEPFEVTNITGNVALYKGSLIVHAHVTLSDRDMHAFGGHVVELSISGTLELVFTSTTKLVKDDDPVTGLKLFALER